MRSKLGKRLRGISARSKRLLALSLRRGVLKRRKPTPLRNTELSALEVKLLMGGSRTKRRRGIVID